MFTTEIEIVGVISEKSFVFKMSEFVDPLGFTRQTELLLRGVEAQNLIQEFKKRNISTETLHKLAKEDLMKLGKYLYWWIVNFIGVLRTNLACD